MPSILLVTSSPRGNASHSNRIATEFVEKLLIAQPESTVVKRDLVLNPLPHIDQSFATGIATPADRRSERQAGAIAISDQVVEEVFSADTIVVAVAMINLSIPSTLKAWLDYLARSGRTFRYTESGSEGLVKDKKVYLFAASGGTYSEGPEGTLDYAVPYMISILGFMGMTDVEVIRVEGTALGDDAERKALSMARNRIDKLAAAA